MKQTKLGGGKNHREEKNGKELVSELQKAQSESRPDAAERYNRPEAAAEGHGED